MRYSFLFLLILPWLAGCDKTEISDSQATGFVKYYNTYTLLTAADARETSGGYVLLGTAETFNEGTQICLIRTDKYGDLLNDSILYFGRSLADRAFRIEVLVNGDLAILGSSQNPATEKMEVFLMRTNSSGETIWSRFLGGNGNTEAFDFEINANGDFILAGYLDTLRQNILNKDIWLFGLNEDGLPIPGWSRPRHIGGEQDETANDLHVLPNGELLLTGKTNSFPAGSPLNQCFIVKTTPTGIIRTFYPISSAEDQEGVCITALDDGYFCILGNTRNPSGTNGTDVFLRKLNPDNLQEIWYETYGNSGNDLGRQLLQSGNNLFILLTQPGLGTSSSIALLQTDAAGNETQSSLYGAGSTQLTAGRFALTADGGFIIAGSNKHSEANTSAALIKVP